MANSSLTQSLPKLLRVKQWAKNLFVFAALIFAGAFNEPSLFVQALIAFFAFCFVSSATYIANDLADVEKDRLHPQKQHRPIASGAVKPPAAIVIGAVLLITGLGLAYSLGLSDLGIILVYLVTQVLYNLKLKQVAVADVFTIAFGFVLRAAMGAAAINEPMSGWLFVCTGFIALMLGFAKRRNEFIAQGNDRAATRSSLTAYNQLYLDILVAVCAGMAVMGYAIYTIQSNTAQQHPGLILTLPFVMYGICRYLLLVFKKNSGGEPADILFGDKHVGATLVGFVVAAVLALSDALPIERFLTQ